MNPWRCSLRGSGEWMTLLVTEICAFLWPLPLATGPLGQCPHPLTYWRWMWDQSEGSFSYCAPSPPQAWEGKQHYPPRPPTPPPPCPQRETERKLTHWQQWVLFHGITFLYTPPRTSTPCPQRSRDQIFSNVPKLLKHNNTETLWEKVQIWRDE